MNKEKNFMIHVRVDKELYEILLRVAMESEASVSEVIRAALELFFRKGGKY